MFGLQGDFDSYLDELRKARRRSVVFLALAIAITLFFGVASLWFLMSNQVGEPSGWFDFANIETTLNLAHFFFNVAVATLMRYWYLRQDKLTTLLTQAMVIEQKHTTAIRLLLKKRRSR